MFTTLFIASATVEALSEIIFQGFKVADLRIKLIVNMILGVGIALSMPQADLFQALAVTVYPPILGRVLTGLIFSRGSQFLHDFLSLTQGIKTSFKPATAPSVSNTGGGPDRNLG